MQVKVVSHGSVPVGRTRGKNGTNVAARRERGAQLLVKTKFGWETRHCICVGSGCYKDAYGHTFVAKES